MARDVVIRVAGRAGDGSYSTCGILAKVAKRMGYYVFEHREVHSNIKGLPTAFTIRISTVPCFSIPDEVDALVCFDGEGLEHLGEMRSGGLMLYDSSPRSPTAHGEAVLPSEDQKKIVEERGLTVFAAPLAEMAKENFSEHLMRNTIALGALAKLLSLQSDNFAEFIRAEYGGKKKKGAEEVVERNLRAYTLGENLVVSNKWQYSFYGGLEILQDPGRLIILGNELIALGALAGGCRAFAGYPITPASEIFEFMMKHLRKLGGVAVQADSEIAAISMAVGMSYAGCRAMTATSGPGLSLMQEALSGAGMTETPIVIAHVQRGGPSTGLPTRSSQEDLGLVLYGGHGEFSRIVICPATPEEGFLFGAQALNLAEKFQCVVFILTEKEFGQSRYTIDALPFDKVVIDRGKVFEPKTPEEAREYKRFLFTEDGVSPRAFPGTPGVVSMVNSTEHHETGHDTENPDLRNRIVEKRMQKEETARQSGFLPAPVLEESGSSFGIISFGSTYGPIQDAREILGDGKPDFLRLTTLWPFPAKEVKKFIKNHKKVLVAEHNFAGQLRRLIQQEATGPSRKLVSLRKYDGRPFRPLEIVKAILAMTSKKGGVK